MKPRGSILLFKTTGTLVDRAICLATKGPYVHVELVIDGARMIGAQTNGIEMSLIPWDARLYTSIDMLPYTSIEGITNGLAWAQQQVGRAYGWADIVFQAVKFVAPNNPLQWGVEGHWDCSDYVTRYIQQSGIVLPNDFDTPYANTPNDIARIFGVLPPRKADQASSIPIRRLDARENRA
jgi:uncharacterized protein YycO